MNLNKAFILGNLTRDPEKRSLPSGQPVVSFGVATNRFFTDRNQEKRKEAEFHNIVLFGRLADIASQYLRKGSLVLIEGRLKTRDWQDSAGIKHYRTEIIGERIQLGPKISGQTTSFLTEEEYREDNKFNNLNKNKEELIDEKDIPVIEEDFKSQFEQKKDQEEIDVREIPF